MRILKLILNQCKLDDNVEIGYVFGEIGRLFEMTDFGTKLLELLRRVTLRKTLLKKHRNCQSNDCGHILACSHLREGFDFLLYELSRLIKVNR